MFPRKPSIAAYGSPSAPNDSATRPREDSSMPSTINSKKEAENHNDIENLISVLDQSQQLLPGKPSRNEEQKQRDLRKWTRDEDTFEYKSSFMSGAHKTENSKDIMAWVNNTSAGTLMSGLNLEYSSIDESSKATQRINSKDEVRSKAVKEKGAKVPKKVAPVAIPEPLEEAKVPEP